jgi:NADPH:quinone reductase-like Zn-dependent oxidoreductase
MKSIVIDEFGDINQFKVIDTPIPKPGEGEVLVEIRAAAVNPYDAKVRQGYMKDLLAFTFPHILGGDVAGIVKEIGVGVTHFQPGDEVYGRAKTGAYTEYTIVPQDALANKPVALSFEDAAGSVTAGLTSWYGLTHYAKASAGETVLVQGGSGGTGSMAVQLAKIMGLTVYATTSSKNAELVKSLGADKVVAYDLENFEEVLDKVDIVLDTVGGETGIRSLSALKNGGRLISFTQPPEHELIKEKGIQVSRIFNHGSKVDYLGLNYMSELYEKGKLKLVIGHSLPLTVEGIKEAHMLIMAKHNPGKIVLFTEVVETN